MQYPRSPYRAPDLKSATAWVFTTGALVWFYLWSYGDALGAFFSLDDYWELAAVDRLDIGRLSDLVGLFRPDYPSFLLYRPFSTIIFYLGLKQAFGHDPFAYHATMVAFHVANSLLVFGIAKNLFRSTSCGIATSFTYALAPGHSIAVYWMALFTMTGTAFFYFAAFLAWIRPGRGRRVGLSFFLFLVALLASEHAVTLPVLLSITTLVLEPPSRWKEDLRLQSPFYVVMLLYVGAKLYYLYSTGPVLAAYSMQLAPTIILRQLGRYLGFAFNFFYRPDRGDNAAFLLGVAVVVAAATSAFTTVWWQCGNRALRVGALGFNLFVLALAPVIFLPNHQQSYYVGIAGLGMALAAVGMGSGLLRPRMRRTVLAALCLALLCVHATWTRLELRRNSDAVFFDGASETSLRWLYTIWFMGASNFYTEVVIPDDPVTRRLFDPGDPLKADTVFLCPPMGVRLSADIDAEVPSPGGLVLKAPWSYPQQRSWRRKWDWLDVACNKTKPQPYE